MNQRWYTNRISFRIIFPVVGGLILYLALLMVFGNLEAISEVFFSQEALFIILLTYLNHEWSIFLLGRRRLRELTLGPKLPCRLVYPGILLASSILINSGITLVYFIYILEYYHYLTELVTINILMIIFQMMMVLYYISMLNIRRYNTLLLEREEMQAGQLELELESFKAEMKPDLLMECLENLLSIMRTDTRKAEQYIQGLSSQYRYLLDNRQKEFVDLEMEIEALKELLLLINGGEKEKIILNGTPAEPGFDIIPGTLQNLVYNIENTMILSSVQPMELSIRRQKKGDLLICHPKRPRLVPGTTISIERLNRSYLYFTGRALEKSDSGKEICWRIPVIPEIEQDQ
jgi:hypothetical protein